MGWAAEGDKEEEAVVSTGETREGSCEQCVCGGAHTAPLFPTLTSKQGKEGLSPASLIWCRGPGPGAVWWFFPSPSALGSLLQIFTSSFFFF